jgi:hypothetical protein
MKLEMRTDYAAKNTGDTAIIAHKSFIASGKPLVSLTAKTSPSLQSPSLLRT